MPDKQNLGNARFSNFNYDLILAHLINTSRNIWASEGTFEIAKTVFWLPWNAATIFSAGITYETKIKELLTWKKVEKKLKPESPITGNAKMQPSSLR